jgi:hypothetical protein
VERREALNKQRIIPFSMGKELKITIIWVIKSRRVKWVWHVMHRRRRGAYRVLVRKSEGKRPLIRPRCRWEDNTKMA